MTWPAQCYEVGCSAKVVIFPQQRHLSQPKVVQFPAQSARCPTPAPGSHPHPWDRSNPRRNPEQSPGAGSVAVRSGVSAGASPESRRPGCIPSLRSADRSPDERPARRLALAAIESTEGGLEELVESRSQPDLQLSDPRVRRSSSEAKHTTSLASSSYEGDRGLGANTIDLRSSTHYRA
jgi:hypothetical protein